MRRLALWTALVGIALSLAASALGEPDPPVLLSPVLGPDRCFGGAWGCTRLRGHDAFVDEVVSRDGRTL